MNALAKRLAIKTLENQRGVSAAKAETIRHNGIQRHVLLKAADDRNACGQWIQVVDVGGSAEEFFLHHQ